MKLEEKKEVEELSVCIRANPPIRVEDYRNLDILSLSSEAQDILHDLYIETIGAKKAYKIGSNGSCWSNDFADSKLRDKALEILKISNPDYVKKMLRQEEGRRFSDYCGSLPSGLGSLSEIVGDVVPSGRRDRGTGIVS